MENYSIESLPEPDPRERRITRLLLFFWLGLGLVVVAILCYIAFQAFRPVPVEPVFVGDLDKYPPNSITLEYVNADFFDDTSGKSVDTLPLNVVRDATGNFTVFFGRSTRQQEAVLIPRQCVVEWDDSLMQFLELCGGSVWSRDGKYVSGPAPRDLDRFPTVIKDNKLYILPKLEPGATH